MTRSEAQKAWRVKQIACPICGETRTVHTDTNTPQRCRRCYWDSLRKSSDEKAATKRRNGRDAYWRNPEHFREKNRGLRRPYVYDDHVRARHLVATAVRGGHLTKGYCGDCGTDEAIQAHHPDYSQPYEVEWLCSRCHGRRHRKD